MSSSSAPADWIIDQALIARATDYVREFMQHYDPSHDFHHIQRVLHNARIIQACTPNTSRNVVTLAALLHDVGDRKYIQPGQDPTTLVRDALLSLGCAETLADKIQTIISGVSYSSEVKDPDRVRRLVGEHPELAVVQDADRLDAMGAVGVGRAFAFGAARGGTLGDAIAHFDEKLLALEGLMKTEKGREMARVRSERLRLMREWWREEAEGVGEEASN